MQRWQDTQRASFLTLVIWISALMEQGLGKSAVCVCECVCACVCACVVLHLIRRCFEFTTGHPLNRRATDGHCFRNISCSKEQLAVFPTPRCACFNLISLISVCCVGPCPWLTSRENKKAPTVNQASLQEPYTKMGVVLLRWEIIPRAETISHVVRLSAQLGEHNTAEASSLKIQRNKEEENNSTADTGD